MGDSGKSLGCSASHGPTRCTEGSCFCDEGYCRYHASTGDVKKQVCIQRVPDSTCRYSFCYKDNKCSPQSALLSLAAPSNSTESSTEDRELLREQDKAIALNLAMFVLWTSAFLSALTAAATFAYRKFRVQQEEETGYTQFLTCD